jgi:hypothetical protein
MVLIRCLMLGSSSTTKMRAIGSPSVASSYENVRGFCTSVWYRALHGNGRALISHP